jgi:Phage gp6-like head-tail connector protein
MADLTTLGSVKVYLGITFDTADAKLSAIITACSAWIASWLNRDILQAPYTETMNGTGSRQIQLSNYPVTALSQVLVDGIDLTNYATSDGRRVVTLPYGSSFTRGLSNVQITYTAGYATVPADLEHTACRMVAWGYTESSRIQQNSKSMGGEVVSFSTAMAPAWALENLKNWRKVV